MVADNFPEDIDLICAKEQLDYFDVQTMEISNELSAMDFYVLMTQHQPKWIGYSFSVRDFFCRLFGIKTIQGFTEGGIDREAKKAHFFQILDEQQDKLTLAIRDKHLDVCICIRLMPLNEQKNRVHVIASVKEHNILGKIYMVPVAKFHPIVVKSMFKNIDEYELGR